MQIPTNAKTIAFCFFEGSTLSIPVGLLIERMPHFTPPEWVGPIYVIVVGFSVLSLIVWSLMCFQDLPMLAWMGLNTVLFVFIPILLLPALNGG
jgi:hypothetical protein